MRDATGMNLIKDRLYEVVKDENSDITVRYTYGYITKYNRIKYGIDKSHVNDAQVISGNPNAKLCCDMWELRQVRRHNRQIHRCNILKGGKLKRNQSAYCVKGYRLWDLVRYKGNLYLIKAKRSRGSFCLMGLDGNKRDSVGYKHLRIVTISNRLIKIKTKKRGCNSSHS